MSTPHQLRADALKMAKDILFEDYYAKRNVVDQNWQIDCEAARTKETKLPVHPGYDDAPTPAKIITMAKLFNEFVSTDNRK